MKAKPDPDLAKWCAALAAPIIEDEVPPGWMTARELAKKLGKADSTMGKLLNRAVVEGRAAKQSFRITSGQVTRPVPHYRLK
jgi:response regulator of citrate/malate metabolism